MKFKQSKLGTLKIIAENNSQNVTKILTVTVCESEFLYFKHHARWGFEKL